MKIEPPQTIPQAVKNNECKRPRHPVPGPNAIQGLHRRIKESLECCFSHQRYLSAIFSAEDTKLTGGSRFKSPRLHKLISQSSSTCESDSALRVAVWTDPDSAVPACRSLSAATRP